VLTAVELTDRVRLTHTTLNNSMESGVDIDINISAQQRTCKLLVFLLHMRGQERTKVKTLAKLASAY
jgi:hypothetical protein